MSASSTPFLNLDSFPAPMATPGSPGPPAPAVPFLSVYETAGPDGGTDPAAEVYQTFLTELYDERMDDALAELSDEAVTLYRESLDSGTGDPVSARRAVERHFAPQIAEIEAMFEHLATEIGDRDAAGLAESEIDAAVAGYQPAVPFSPAFEQLFGSLRKLAGAAVGAVRMGIGKIAQLGLKKLLGRIRRYIPAWVRGVLDRVINGLSPELRPVAQTLARRLGLPGTSGETPDELSAASPDVTVLQLELDGQVARLLFAPDEVEQELETARASAPATAPGVTLAEFERAQDEFIGRLAETPDDADPTPHVEAFLPALAPILRPVLQVTGSREFAVRTIAGLIGKFLGRFVGDRYRTPLSRAIADTGLRALGLEVPADHERRAAPAAVAATVMETVRQLGALPDDVLDDRTLLEALTLEAFEQAAATYLPPVLPDEVYRERPDLLPAGETRGFWLPRRRYRKFSRVFPIRVTPQKAAAVATVGGVTLAEFLQEQLGAAPGETVPAEAHLYEAVPGSTLPDLTRAEAPDVPGLAGGTSAVAQLHPLTPAAAGVLLGEPLLGRPVSARAMGTRHALDLGQRLYHLAVPGRRPLAAAGGGRTGVRRHSSVHVRVDFPAGVVVVSLFLSETRAQKLAVRLRQAGHPGSAAVALKPFLERALRAAFSGGVRGRVRLVHEALTPEQALGAGLRLLAPAATEAFTARLRDWVVRSLTDFFRDRTAQFTAAAEDPQDGITVVCTLRRVPGLDTLRKALAGGRWTPPATGTPEVSVTVTPGYRHD